MLGITVVFGSVRYASIFITESRLFSDFYRDMHPQYVGHSGDKFYVVVENFYSGEESFHPFNREKINPERLYQLLLKLTETSKP